jgi:Bacterial regulatory protein, Fis family
VVDEIEQLWEAFGGNDRTIFCVNTDGTVVHARLSPARDDDLLLNVSAAARQLGISRTTVYARLRQLRAAGMLCRPKSCALDKNIVEGFLQSVKYDRKVSEN